MAIALVLPALAPSGWAVGVNDATVDVFTATGATTNLFRWSTTDDFSTGVGLAGGIAYAFAPNFCNSSQIASALGTTILPRWNPSVDRRVARLALRGRHSSEWLFARTARTFVMCIRWIHAPA